jgi:hypothetical protein
MVTITIGSQCTTLIFHLHTLSCQDQTFNKRKTWCTDSPLERLKSACLALQRQINGPRITRKITKSWKTREKELAQIWPINSTTGMVKRTLRTHREKSTESVSIQTWQAVRWWGISLPASCLRPNWSVSKNTWTLLTDQCCKDLPNCSHQFSSLNHLR